MMGFNNKPRYINEAIELELVLFKREIEEKFAKSLVNRLYTFPRIGDPFDINVQQMSRPVSTSRNIRKSQSSGRLHIYNLKKERRADT